MALRTWQVPFAVTSKEKCPREPMVGIQVVINSYQELGVDYGLMFPSVIRVPLEEPGTAWHRWESWMQPSMTSTGVPAGSSRFLKMSAARMHHGQPCSCALPFVVKHPPTLSPQIRQSSFVTAMCLKQAKVCLAWLTSPTLPKLGMYSPPHDTRQTWMKILFHLTKAVTL